MSIFVDTDIKLYKGSKAGNSAPAAAGKMQKVVKGIIDKAAGFTTKKTDPVKGYKIRLEVSKVVQISGKTQCSLSGSIVRYSADSNGEEKEEMLSTGMNGNATADGISDASLLDCIEAIAENLASKSVPIMRADIVKW